MGDGEIDSLSERKFVGTANEIHGECKSPITCQCARRGSIEVKWSREARKRESGKQ